VAGFFQDLLSVQALAQMQVAQHRVVAVPFQLADGILAVERETDAGGATLGQHVAQDAAHALIILDDEEAFAGQFGNGQVAHGWGWSVRVSVARRRACVSGGPGAGLGQGGLVMGSGNQGNSS
jgi:hypothetical protein